MKQALAECSSTLPPEHPFFIMCANLASIGHSADCTKNQGRVPKAKCSSGVVLSDTSKCINHSLSVLEQSDEHAFIDTLGVLGIKPQQVQSCRKIRRKSPEEKIPIDVDLNGDLLTSNLRSATKSSKLAASENRDNGELLKKIGGYVGHSITKKKLAMANPTNPVMSPHVNLSRFQKLTQRSTMKNVEQMEQNLRDSIRSLKDGGADMGPYADIVSDVKSETDNNDNVQFIKFALGKLF